MCAFLYSRVIVSQPIYFLFPKLKLKKSNIHSFFFIRFVSILPNCLTTCQRWNSPKMRRVTQPRELLECTVKRMNMYRSRNLSCALDRCVINFQTPNLGLIMMTFSIYLRSLYYNSSGYSFLHCPLIPRELQFCVMSLRLTSPLGDFRSTSTTRGSLQLDNHDKCHSMYYCVLLCFSY